MRTTVAAVDDGDSGFDGHGLRGVGYLPHVVCGLLRSFSSRKKRLLNPAVWLCSYACLWLTFWSVTGNVNPGTQAASLEGCSGDRQARDNFIESVPENGVGSPATDQSTDLT